MRNKTSLKINYEPNSSNFEYKFYLRKGIRVSGPSEANGKVTPQWQSIKSLRVCLCSCVERRNCLFLPL